MAQGGSTVVVWGNVGDPISVGENTGRGLAMSFMVAIEERSGERPIWVKCNTYGVLAENCRRKLHSGCYVVAMGKFMHRRRQDGVGSTEVECIKVVFPTPVAKREEST